MLKLLRVRLKIFTVFLLGLACCGCLFAKSVPKVGPRPPVILVDAKVLNKARLKKGGPLLIVPFTAAENVAQTEALESAALRVVRGLTDELQNQTVLVPLSSDNSGKAELIIKGRIVKMKEAQGFVPLWNKKTTRYFGVEGEMIVRESGEPVLLFSQQAQSQYSFELFNDLAQRVGHDVGRFIVSAIK